MDLLQATRKLGTVDEEKVSNIVEVCNVTRDEAHRVLDACHMDERMAIERFLSGTEVSAWSQVSKKKKPSTHTRPGASTRNPVGYSRIRDKERDHENNRKHRDPSYHHDSKCTNGIRRGSRQHRPHSQHGAQKPREGSALMKNRTPTEKVGMGTLSSLPQQEPSLASRGPLSRERSMPDRRTHIGGAAVGKPKGSHGSCARPLCNETDVAFPRSQDVATPPSVWAQRTSSGEGIALSPSKPVVEHGIGAVSSTAQDTLQKPATIPHSAMKRTFNYAAAVAAGTSHAKSIADLATLSPLPPSDPVSFKVEAEDATICTNVEEVLAPESVGSKKRRGRIVRSSGSDPDGPDHVPPSGESTSNKSLPTSKIVSRNTIDSRSEGVADIPTATREPSVSLPSTWGTRPPSGEQSSEEQLEDTVAAIAADASVAVRNEQGTGDILSLQFGSFGLTRLDGVNWSSSDNMPSPNASSAVSGEPSTVASAALVIASPGNLPVDTPPMASVGKSSLVPPVSISRPISLAPENHSHTQASLSVTPVGATGSGIFPVLPLAPAGNFAPNYGNPYIMPPLHAYSPGLGSYENAGDLNSSRGPNLGPPGSLPLYDPTTLSGAGKYGAIPGLGDMAALPVVAGAVGKDGMHSNTEMDKNTSLGTSALPAGVDALGAPYMVPGVPGYPSMQYPHMYTFPNGGYPPGMAAAPSPFPYPNAGQVSSHGTRGSFGFEDGSAQIAGNVRGGAGLGESMYTPGAYLNSSVGLSNSHKGPPEAPYKQIRGNSHPGNGVGAMGMASGVVHGMAYSDYPNALPAVNDIASSGAAAAGWNSRQSNISRSDGQNGPATSTQTIAGVTQNSGLYATAPNGAPGGYWAPQQGGYYP